MGGSRVLLEPGFELDELPFGVLVLDRDGTIKSYKPFESAASNVVSDGLIGQNFFSDVAPSVPLQRFHERLWAFVALAKNAVEPFEFVFPRSNGTRVTMLFIRDSEIEGRISLIVMKNGAVT